MKDFTPSDSIFPIDKFLWELEQIINMDSGTADVEGCRQVAAFFEARLKAAGLTVECIPYGADRRPLVIAVSPGAKMPDLKAASDIAIGAASCAASGNTSSGRTSSGSTGARDSALASAAAANPASKTFDFLLAGHMDTVFAKGTAARRPFRLDQDAGLAYGPGTVDMKAGALLMVYIAEYLTRQAPEISLCLALNSDEETGSADSAPLLIALGRCARRAFVFEGGRKKGQFVHQRKGCLKYEIEVSGIASHAGTAPQQGASAIVEMAHLILKLDKLKRYDRGTSLNVGLTRGGSALNVVADYAVSQMEVRYTSEGERKRIEKALSKLQAAPYVSGTTISIRQIAATPPLNLTPETAQMMAQMEEYDTARRTEIADRAESNGRVEVAEWTETNGRAEVTEQAGVTDWSEIADHDGITDRAEIADHDGIAGRAEVTDRAASNGRAEVAEQAGLDEQAEVTDPPVAFVSAGGLSDANRLALCGIPVIDGCGPSGGFPHSEKEFLSIATVERRFRFMCGVIQYLFDRSN